MKEVIVFDLDGTLACGRHRLHLLPKKEDIHLTSAWESFNLDCVNDEPIEDNIELLQQLYKHYEIVILTGRSSIAMIQTLEWLDKYNILYDRLIMRDKDDDRTDIEVKEEALLSVGLDKILCCYDDLEHIARHIRSLGVTCHLVTHYDESRVDIDKRDK